MKLITKEIEKQLPKLYSTEQIPNLQLGTVMARC